MSSLDWLLAVIGTALQCMVLSTMLKGAFRRYPLIFGYLIFTLLSTAAQLSFKDHFGPQSKTWMSAYWVTDFIGTLLILIIIIHLIRTAMEHHRHRQSVYCGLLLGVVTTAVSSLLLMHFSSRGFNFGRWMTEVGRDYYFSALLLNAVLWWTLMRSHSEDKQLYLITSGLGIKLAAAAIAHALRMTGTLIPLANQILVPAYLLHLYVWYVALKRFPAVVPAVQEQVSAPHAEPAEHTARH
jgi:hypothetical protein